ncbi:MAG TPA: hypothetical protein VHA05_01980 [Candidatus Saccharimonadales bacterium]|nr:hypothetical protein [Candidatus Saccharimonadales bacterium]
MNRMRVGIGIGLIVILLIVGVYLLVQASSDNNSPPPAHKPGTHQPATGSQNKPTEPTTKKPGSSTANQSLSNSGPGDTLALFLGASVLGYVFFISRKAARSR